MGWRVVQGDVGEAEEAVAAGEDVVLLVAPGVPVDLHRLRGAGPGRAAVLVAEPADPAAPSAAAEMAAEVFGRPRPA